MTFKEYITREIAESNDKIENYQNQIETLEDCNASLPQNDSQEKQELQAFIGRRIETVSSLKEIVEIRKQEELRLMELIRKLDQK